MTYYRVAENMLKKMPQEYFVGILRGDEVTCKPGIHHLEKVNKTTCPSRF